MTDDIEGEAEKIWDLWREGLITHEEVQKRLGKILPWQPQGFFKKLQEEIGKIVNNRIPAQAKRYLEVNAYFSKRGKIEAEIVKTTNWAVYWQNQGWLEYPTEQDKKDVHQLNEEDLTELHIVVFQSLIQMANEDMQNSEKCKMLHEYYKLTGQEMCDRGLMADSGPQADAFLEYLGKKQTIKTEEERMEEARQTGEFCPYCDSQNVGSYNKQQWYCRDCKKRWRKH